MIANGKTETCGACGTYSGHAVDCERVTRESLQRYCEYLEREHKWQSSRAERFLEQVTLWQGKFRIVKAENNKLRSKLRKVD